MVSSATPISPLRRHALNCTALFQTNGRFAPIPAIQQLISFLLYYLLISRELTQLCNFSIQARTGKPSHRVCRSLTWFFEVPQEDGEDRGFETSCGRRVAPRFSLALLRSRRRRRHSNCGKSRKLCKLPRRGLIERRLPASDSSPNQAGKRKSGRSGIRPWQEIWHRRSPRPRSSSRPLLNSQSYTSDLRNLLEP
jgi:hypothetical protein